MVGGIFYEHGHRMVATSVGFFTIILAIWLWKRESRRSIRVLGVVALAAVIIQGILGGLTVLYLLPTQISVSHACLGQIFFCIMVAIAVVTSRKWKSTNQQITQRIGLVALSLTGVILIQLVLGAIMRHTGAGLAIPDFPLAFGHLIPPALTAGIGIHFAHRVWGMGVLALAFFQWVWMYRHHRKESLLFGLNSLLMGLILFQIVLGGVTILSAKAVFPTTAHVACGAIILATSFMISLFSIRRFGFPERRKFKDYWQLGKPRITFLVCVTTWVGFYLASPESSFNSSRLVWTILSTALVAFGSGALNQVMERKTDRLMQRTSSRPLPSGRLKPKDALLLGVATSIAGVLFFLCKVNLLSAGLAVFTLLSYLFVYTPLKRRTPYSTLIGAVPGAIPPLIGWAGALGHLSYGAWILFAILFLWQLPHFFAIGWLYAEDYAKANLPILSAVNSRNRMLSAQLYLYCIVLVPVALLPTLIGLTGFMYFWGALVLGLGFLYLSCLLTKHRSKLYARRLLLGSVLYLPLLLTLMAVDKV